MIPIIVAAARGLAGGLAKKTVKTLAKKSAKKKIKNTQDVKGSDLRPENREEESGEIEQEQLKIIEQDNTDKEKDNDKLISKAKIAQEKSESRIVKTEEEINQIKDSLENKENPDYKTDPELIKIEKEKLEILRDQLTIQKEQLEEQKEAEYEREHERKTSLKEKAKSMAIKVKDGAKAGMGSVVDDVKKNKGLLAKLMGGAALIAAFWPMIKEKIGSFVEWIADNIPDLIKGVWESVKKMASGIMDMVVKYGPGLIQNVINGLAEVASSLLDGIIKYGPQVLTMLINGVKTLAEKVLSGIVEYGPQVGMMLWDGFKGLIKAIIPLMVEYIPKILGMLWDGVTYIVPEIIGFAGELAGMLWDGVTSKLTELKDWVIESIGNIWDDIQDFIYDKTAGIFGTEKLDDKEKEQVQTKIDKTNFSRSSDDFRDQLAELGILDKEITTKDEIESEAKLKLLPNEQLVRLAGMDWLDEKGKKTVKKYISKNNQEAIVQKEEAEALRISSMTPKEIKEEKNAKVKKGIEVHRAVFTNAKNNLESKKEGITDEDKLASMDKSIAHFDKLLKRLDAKEQALNTEPLQTMVANQTDYSMADGKGGTVNISKEEYNKLEQYGNLLNKAMDNNDDDLFNKIDTERNNFRKEILSSKENPVGDMVKAHKKQYAEGGHTGDGDSKEIAGVVHYNEFVLSEKMLNEIEDAKTEGEKNALIEKAAAGKGKNAIEAIRKLIKRGEPSGHSATIDGVTVMLTNAQKEEYDKLAQETEDEYELMDKEETFVKNVARGNHVDKDKNKVRFASEPSKPANQTNISKLSTLSPVTKEKVVDIINGLDKASLSAAQSGLMTLGLIDENGNLAGQTDSEKGINTSAMLRNQTSVTDVSSMIAPQVGNIAKNETGMGKEAKKEAGSETTKANDKLTKMVKEDTSKEPKLFG
ncbi:MAG: hypothetical protein U9R03_01640, partial [Candidatus Aerophobetes bacterium]|nr:hypothetical protein [Candidatus Aerophobetes bacterium]